MAWSAETLNETVDRELASLPVGLRAKLIRISELIETQGLENVREPYVKYLEGRLWEIRIKGRDGISRAIYVTATGRLVVIVRVFVKKTQRTPRREITLALLRAKEVQ